MNPFQKPSSNRLVLYLISQDHYGISLTPKQFFDAGKLLVYNDLNWGELRDERKKSTNINF